MFKVKVLIEIERRVIDEMEPEVAGVALSAELQGVVAYQFVVDMYLDEGVLVVRHKL